MTSPLGPPTFPFVARLTTDSRRELDALVPLRVEAGQTVVTRGDPAAGAYFVTRGSLRVFYITENGREATLYHVSQGGTCVLALGATISGEPYPAWVQSGAHGGQFVRIPPPLFHRLVNGEAAFRQYVLSALAGRVFDLMTKLEEIGSTRVEQRVALYLLRWDQAGLIQATQSAIASELGTAREVVSRTMRALAQRGLVRSGRGRVLILDRPGLERLAQGPG